LKEAEDSRFIIRRVVDPDVSMQFMIAYSLQRPTTLAMRELVRILRMEVNRAVTEGRLMGRLWSEL
jgi:LysR family transcriptional regulator, nitrogen assimilation regulatory protein